MAHIVCFFIHFQTAVPLLPGFLATPAPVPGTFFQQPLKAFSEEYIGLFSIFSNTAAAFEYLTS